MSDDRSGESKGIPGVVETTPHLADLLVAHLSMILGQEIDSNFRI